jgi:hypothetical protein
MIKMKRPTHTPRFFEFLLQLNSSLKARGSNSNRTFANDLEPANFVNREPSDVIEISVLNPVRMRPRAQEISPNSQLSDTRCGMRPALARQTITVRAAPTGS